MSGVLSANGAQGVFFMGNMFDLSGRVAIVSGTASGMGEAMARTFAEYGADLVLLDMNTAG
ncbi:MAG: hypothetical protein ABIQ99_00280, partial [Thermoflexales bacterium]